MYTDLKQFVYNVAGYIKPIKINVRVTQMVEKYVHVYNKKS